MGLSVKNNFFLDIINIILELEKIPSSKLDEGGSIGDYIKSNLNKIPAVVLIDNIQQHVKENPTMMGNIIGEELALKILKLYE
jgi:hypothetical protein